jgi:hypothetical protein
MHYTWPDILPTELEMPFLLGYFDGDGSLQNRCQESPNASACGMNWHPPENS